jgi:hypothetical protein
VIHTNPGVTVARAVAKIDDYVLVQTEAGVPQPGFAAFHDVEVIPPAPSNTPISTPTITPTLVPADAFEPDDEPGLAKSIGCGETEARTLGGDDGDWVKFSLSAPASVHLEVLTDIQVSLELYSTALGMVLEGSDDDRAPPHLIERSCAAPLAAGPYHAYIVDGSPPGAYDLRLTCTPCP